MEMRLIGIDLAVKGRHTAAIYDPARQTFLVKRFRFRTRTDDMEKLLAKARQDAPHNVNIAVILEATGMSWFPVGLFFHRHGATVYRVNGRYTKAQRKTSWPHARSDQLDSMALVMLYTSLPKERLIPWQPPSSAQMALQRMARELQRLIHFQVNIHLRLQALNQWAWNGWERLIPAAYREWVWRRFYDPWTVAAYGIEALTQALQESYPNANTDWIPNWVTRAQEMSALYQTSETVGYDYLSQFASRELERLEWVAQQRVTLVKEHFLPLYRQLYPQDPLLSIQGIGERSAAIYRGFVLPISRFRNANAFAQWTGMVPRSDQSGTAQRPHMPLSKKGPNLIKATLYQNAEVARQWDVQLAQVYYNQMVSHGKHHTQAVCAVASHLARRIYAVLRDNRPYELRDLKGNPITKADSRALILKEFRVPESLRKQRRKHHHG